MDTLHCVRHRTKIRIEKVISIAPISNHKNTQTQSENKTSENSRTNCFVAHRIERKRNGDERLARKTIGCKHWRPSKKRREQPHTIHEFTSTRQGSGLEVAQNLQGRPHATNAERQLNREPTRLPSLKTEFTGARWRWR